MVIAFSAVIFGALIFDVLCDDVAAVEFIFPRLIVAAAVKF